MKSGTRTDESPPTQSETAARRLTVLFVAFAGSWATLVALACRVVVGMTDSLELAPRQIEELFLTMRLHGIAAVVLMLLLLVLRRRRTLRPFWPRVAMLILLILLFGSTDRIVGVIFPPAEPMESLLSPHPRRGYAHRANTIGFVGGRNIRTDQLGFRGGPLAIPKPANEFRILFLGDSVAFGYLLPDDQAIPPVAEAALKQRVTGAKSIRCLNAGVAGYATWQEFDLLQDEGRRAAPDVVVLVFCLNDVIESAAVGRGVVRGQPGELFVDAGNHWSGVARAIGLFAARRRERQAREQNFWDNVPVGEGGDPERVREFEDACQKPMAAKYERSWDVVLQDVAAMRDICQEMGASFAILYATTSFELSAGERFRVHREKMSAWARANGTPFIDPTDTFQAASASEGVSASDLLMDTVHPTEEGVRLIVDVLVRHLESDGLLPVD